MYIFICFGALRKERGQQLCIQKGIPLTPAHGWLGKIAGYDGVMGLCFRFRSKLWFCYQLVTWLWISSLNLVKSQFPSDSKWRAWAQQTQNFLQTLQVTVLDGWFILVSSWILFLYSLDPISVFPDSYFCIPWILFLTYLWPNVSAPFLVLLIVIFLLVKHVSVRVPAGNICTFQQR